MTLRRSDIRLVDLEPSVGSEAGKVRPAVVVSNDRANATAARLERGVVTVVPMTSNVERVYPFQVLLRADVCGIPLDSKAQAEQLRSLSVVRVGALVGRVPDQLMAELDSALRLHLAL